MKNRERLSVMFKRFAKSAFAARLAASVIGAYIRLVNATTRWTLIDREYFDKVEPEGKGVIVAFWHGRLMMSPRLCQETDRQVFMLISANRDGEIIANAVKSFDLEFIRGSAANPKKPTKNKAGASAVTQILSALADGNVVGVTPDGPRGPGGKVQPGIIKLAQMSGAPILPAGMSVARGRRLSTWDRFLFAAPFSRGFYVAGPPIWVGPENDAETLECTRRKVENALASVTRTADSLAGRKDAEPPADRRETL
jgi:lysophospholipid acyltransferase (LPLAT)-like uncharacterized protein